MGLGSEQEQEDGQFHLLPLQTRALCNGFSSSRSRVDRGSNPAQVHQKHETRQGGPDSKTWNREGL